LYVFGNWRESDMGMGTGVGEGEFWKERFEM